MTEPWATGLDLHLDVDRRRVRASLEAALRDAVSTSRLRPGTSLPSSRVLAQDLGVARNTVVEVYEQLVAEGWLRSRAGAGTVVAERVQSPAVSTPEAAHGYPALGSFDLRPGWPDLSAFPRKEWLRSARRSLTAAPTAALNYAEPRGRPELRDALADYLSRARGVRADPNQIVVCLGTMHGLQVICKALRSRGATRWATESHGLNVHRHAAAALGYTVRLLPVDADGADVTRLSDEDAVLLSPAHQFPLGVALSPQRRRAVVHWSGSTGGLIIEDDYDGEFRYDRRPVGALQALAADRIVYAGTTSKSLAPGLRLGWLVVPPDLLESVMDAKTLSDGHNSVLDQLTLADYIRTGGYDRHVRRMRLRYQRRRDQLLHALAGLHHVEVTGVAAGMHALVRLSPDVDEPEVIRRARQQGLFLEGLDTYTAQPATRPDPGLVIGYAGPPDNAYRECLVRLVATLRSFT